MIQLVLTKTSCRAYKLQGLSQLSCLHSRYLEMTAALLLMTALGLYASDGVAPERLPGVNEIADLDQQIDAIETLATDVRWGLHLSRIGESGSQGLGMIDFRATRAADRIELLETSSLRWSVGGGVHWWSGRELSLELGYVFSREVAIDDLIVSNPSDSWIAQLSWAS